MKKSPVIYLKHILESIKLIEERIKDISYKDFINNIDLQDMVIRRLEIIGEAVRNLPREYREKYPHINWQSPADMRSVLIHGYLEVDLDVVWDTMKNNLPIFKEQIKELYNLLNS